MSFWEKISESEYEFEIKFFGTLLLMGLMIGFKLLMNKWIAQGYLPNFCFLYTPGASWSIFLGAFVVIQLVAELLYYRSYDPEWEFWETKRSLFVKEGKCIAMLLYWCAWSDFCAWLTIRALPLHPVAVITMLLFVIVPGLLCFLATRWMRRGRSKMEVYSILPRYIIVAITACYVCRCMG